MPSDGRTCGTTHGHDFRKADMREPVAAAVDVKSEGKVAVGPIGFREEPGDAGAGN